MVCLTRLDLALITFSTLVGTFFRLYQIDTLPPGLHYDEAFEGLVARELLETGHLKIFFEGNFGLEPLSVYLVAGLYLLFGISATTIRLMPAIAGILAVPALYLLVREMFPQGPWGVPEKVFGVPGQHLSRILAVLSALTLAGLYWHITFSRYGVESNLVPLFEVLVFYFLWRGLRSQRLWMFTVSGALLGLSLYTYQAARMLPFLLAIFFVYYLMLERQRFVEAYWKGLVLLTIATLVTFAPLGYYFAGHPQALTMRATQVQAFDQGQKAADVIASNVNRTLAMFLSRGDEDPRSNLPGRPVFDPILAAPFLLGIALMIPRLGNPRYGFLAIWFVVMLLPMTLSDYAPHFRRSLGATPVVSIAVAIGLTGALSASFWLTSRIHNGVGTALRVAAVGIIVSAIAASAFLTYRDYFLIWGRSKDLFFAFDVGIVDVVRYANSLPSTAEVLLSPVPRAHPTIEFSVREGRRLRSFDGRRGFVVPERSDVDTVYNVITHEDTRSLPLLRRYFPQGRTLNEVNASDGSSYFTSFLVPAGSFRNVKPSYPLTANLSNKVAFLGYSMPRLSYRPGEVIPLVLYWQAVDDIAESYTVFTHILGPWDEKNKTVVWGQQDSLPLGGTYLTADWEKGDIVLDEYAVPIRRDAPPGEYEIEIGMYLLDTGQRLPIVHPATGSPIDDRVVLGKVRVEGP